MKLSLKERKLVLEYAKKLIGKRLNEESSYNDLEFIGPSVDEILDAINFISGKSMIPPYTGNSKYNSLVKIKIKDKSGHKISANKFSVMVTLVNTSDKVIKEAEYIKHVNELLALKDYNCKLYATS